MRHPPSPPSPWKEAQEDGTVSFFLGREAPARTRELKRGLWVWRRSGHLRSDSLYYVRKLLAQAQLLVLPTHPRETEATTLSVDKTTKLEMLDTSAPARSHRSWKLKR